MPLLATLQAFADTVEANDHVGAIEVVSMRVLEASTREKSTRRRSGAATSWRKKS